MTRRTWLSLLLGVAVVVTLLLARRPVQHFADALVVMHNDAPRESAMDEMIAASSDPTATAARLWSAGRIPQRHYAIEYLRSHQSDCDVHWKQVSSVVIEALASVDLDEREPAMMILRKHDPVAVREAAGHLLADIDPEVRLVGLRAVALSKDERESHELLQEGLDDPEKSVRIFCKVSLMSSDSAALQPATSLSDLPASTQALTPRTPLTPTLIPAVDFSIVDLDGKAIRLSALRGKTLLINFWATGCGPCISEMPTLIELQKRHPNDLAIVAISVDGIADDDDESSAPSPDPTPTVRAMVKKMGIPFAVAVDRAGTIVGTYDGTGVPLTVLIDGQGKIRRRFVGPRSLETFERMLGEISPGK